MYTFSLENTLLVYRKEIGKRKQSLMDPELVYSFLIAETMNFRSLLIRYMLADSKCNNFIGMIPSLSIYRGLSFQNGSQIDGILHSISRHSQQRLNLISMNSEIIA